MFTYENSMECNTQARSIFHTFSYIFHSFFIHFHSFSYIFHSFFIHFHTFIRHFSYIFHTFSYTYNTFIRHFSGIFHTFFILWVLFLFKVGMYAFFHDLGIAEFGVLIFEFWTYISLNLNEVFLTANKAHHYNNDPSVLFLCRYLRFSIETGKFVRRCEVK
jgi:hypothetical protein